MTNDNDFGSTTTEWLNSDKSQTEKISDQNSDSECSYLSINFDSQNFLDEIPHFSDHLKPHLKAISSE